MNIETKTVREDPKDYLYFGWKHTEDTRVRTGKARHTEHILARDKDMPNYKLISALEKKYFTLRSMKKSCSPIDGGLCFILFVCLIFPGIIYLIFKVAEQSRIDNYNSPLEREMREILIEVKKLI